MNIIQTREDGPEPYYYTLYSLTMSQREIHGDHYFRTFTVKNAVPFLEGLPVVLITPLKFTYPEPIPLLGFGRPQDELSYLGDGLFPNSWLTLKFRPDGRQFLYTEEDIGQLVIGVYIPI